MIYLLLYPIHVIVIDLLDFVSLELESGNPRLLIDFGSGTTELKIKPPRRLDDGEWHRLDIFWDTEVTDNHQLKQSELKIIN